MKLEITKNTISDGINKVLRSHGDKMVLAVERGIEGIRSATLPHVPVVTGTLKRSLAGKTDENAIYDLNSKKFSGFVTKVEGRIGTKVEYAKDVEYGTSRFSGRYYLTQGLEDSKDDVRKIIINTMKS